MQIVKTTPIWTTDNAVGKIIVASFGGTTIPIIWTGISRLPEHDECSVIMQNVVLAWHSGARFCLMFEHVGEKELGSPDIDFFKVCIATLLEHRELLKRKLVCSCFRAQKFNVSTVLLRDLFLSLYTPQRPLLVSDDEEEIEEFFEDYCTC